MPRALPDLLQSTVSAIRASQGVRASKNVISFKGDYGCQFCSTCFTPAFEASVPTIDAELSPVFQLSYAYCSLDGRFRPEELMQQAIAIGLKGLAITDHHTLAATKLPWLENWKLSNPQLEKPTPLGGVEIAGLLGIEVHILAIQHTPCPCALSPKTSG